MLLLRSFSQQKAQHERIRFSMKKLTTFSPVMALCIGKLPNLANGWPGTSSTLPTIDGCSWCNMQKLHQLFFTGVCDAIEAPWNCS